MLKRIFIYSIFSVLLSLTIVSCGSSTNLGTPSPTVNSKASQKKPYVLLISLDGFRWDYVEKYKPQHLSNFVENGVSAKSLISTFPSKTFPNHYSIATGMYPDNHGIISNSFYSTKKDKIYSIRNREVVTDGDFYGGTPIWSLADRNSMVTASYFFVGSDVEIQGIRPSYSKDYDGKVKNETRISQVLEWLALPKKERPHLITMYFSDMDDTGHRYGPNNEAEIQKTLHSLDKNLGVLLTGLKASGLPINIIIVSDHGMAAQSTDKLIPIERIQNNDLFLAIDNGSMVNIHPKKDVETEVVLDYLKQKEDHFKVYKTEDTPGFEYTPKNKDWGAIQLIPDVGYYFSNAKNIALLNQNNIKTIGVHGFDSNDKDMHGIFYANGPAFKTGHTIPSFQNIDIYPLICDILGFEIPANIDGSLSIVQDILKPDND
ncbi:alkaline phosphatase family protein [Gelidibacter maritimus]|uniref:Alkaline phosphatase family protein n=1 Tax=Gelidibacter maritimus TaxID=2761487 RepID=A0A7W2R2S5_9FLAO|nr:ectonucleotide pyrophosphatase/phosphodiesterase [Gelidibacter maritimus]MBA6151210.1 alkaline phosphatase family protein [Gelidibacter maritimus]